MTKESKEKYKTTPWKVTTNRYVGFVDIMGFKNMISRIPHDEVYSMMKKVSKSVRSIQSVFSVDYESEAEIDINVSMLLFSDSIMLYTRDDDSHSLENLIGSISTLSDSLFTDGIPHKGAIAFGRMTLDFEESIFFGQPLVDAYLLQEELKFYGIVVHGTAEINGDIFEDESVVEYNCPLKSGSAIHQTIVPGVSLSEEFEESTVTELEKKVVAFRINTSGHLRTYIDNTLNYLKTVKEIGNKILLEEENE